MIVVLFTREEIVVSKEEAEAIDSMIASDVKWIRIGEYRVRPSAIALVKPGGHTQADVIEDKSHLLDRPDFRGQESPAKEELRKRFQ